jgi:hypothetical protein
LEPIRQIGRIPLVTLGGNETRSGNHNVAVASAIVAESRSPVAASDGVLKCFQGLECVLIERALLGPWRAGLANVIPNRRSPDSRYPNFDNKPATVYLNPVAEFQTGAEHFSA